MAQHKYTEFRLDLSHIYNEISQIQDKIAIKKEYIRFYGEVTGEDVEAITLFQEEIQEMNEDLTNLMHQKDSFFDKLQYLMKHFTSDFGLLDRITKLCNENDITIAELERQLDFSNSSMRRWNQSTPSLDKVVKVADYFNVTVDSLIGRDISLLQRQQYLLNEILSEDNDVRVTSSGSGDSMVNDEKYLTNASKKAILSYARQIDYSSIGDLIIELGLQDYFHD